jgi:hypothetical protein
MKTLASLALLSFLSAAAPGVARADKPGLVLGAGGMHAHVSKGLTAPGPGAHAKDHHVVRVKMLGNASDKHRTFVAYTEKQTPALGKTPAALRYQFVYGHVDTATGAVVTTSVEPGTK